MESSARADEDWDHVESVFRTGRVHAGQSFREFLQVCIPTKFEQHGRYTFIEIFKTPAFDGISILAKDGKLVRAEKWADFGGPWPYFSVISDEEKKLAFASYQSKPRGLFE